MNGSSEPRRRSLVGRLSHLLANFGVAGDGSNKEEHLREASLAALRQRMTPVSCAGDEPRGQGFARRLQRPPAPPIAERAPVSDPAWTECDSEWKPVLLSDDELTTGMPSLDQLAGDEGLDPATLRFPIEP
jgi:hypothetical protein